MQSVVPNTQPLSMFRAILFAELDSLHVISSGDKDALRSALKLMNADSQVELQMKANQLLAILM